MKQFQTGVPVAIIFFNRADTLQQVFEAVRRVKPPKLFLVQDGARNEKELIKVLACRKVVENVDWECDVVRDYSEMNLGCGMRVSSGITNAFKQVDRLIILEDDCVPSLGMFQFCNQMLEKYKDDDRINMISGMNHVGRIDIPDANYLFCKTGAIWGWATWKRVWDNYEFQMPFFEDKTVMGRFKRLRFPKFYINGLNETGTKRYFSLKEGKKLSAWTYQFAMMRHLYSQLVIVPDRNLISNIGLSDESTHGATDLRLIPKGLRRVFFMKTYDFDQPIKHPKYIMEDTSYDEQVWKIMGISPLTSAYRRMESMLRIMILGNGEQRRKILTKLFKKK